MLGSRVTRLDTIGSNEANLDAFFYRAGPNFSCLGPIRLNKVEVGQYQEKQKPFFEERAHKAVWKFSKFYKTMN